MVNVNSILKNVLEKVNPPKEELKDMNFYLENFLRKFEGSTKKLKIDAEIFVGGSMARNTIIKKDSYDIDVFVRFDKKYKDEGDISELTRKILDSIDEKYIDIHGSRQYFRIKAGPNFSVEIIPVIKVQNPKEAENITDLSYSHVKYIRSKIKSQKTLDEIKIAKAFCYATNSYGAESYIKGFSGYSLELLIYYYKSFLKFIKVVAKSDKKIIIDIEKYYKNKDEILMNLNGAKLQSPIVLIDPTYKQRNVSAALSEETFNKFKQFCKEFLKNPSMKFFEIQTLDLEKIKKNALKKKQEFVLVELKTDRQEGDIAGTKLLKFYEHLTNEIEKYFEIRERGFSYDGKQTGKAFFVVKSKKEILCNGPSVKQKEHVKAFKKMHKKIVVKKGKIYAREKIDFDIKEFFEIWKNKNQMKIVEMDVSGMRIVG